MVVIILVNVQDVYYMCDIHIIHVWCFKCIIYVIHTPAIHV